MQLTKQSIKRLRILKSGLITPFKSVEECVSNLVGIQSQVQQFGEISIFNRTQNITQADLKLLYESHKLIKIWGQRMTVHMYTISDWKTVFQVFEHRNNFVKKGWADKKPTLQEMLSLIDDFTLNKKVTKKELTDLIESKAGHIDNQYRDYSLFLQACMGGILFGVPEMPQTKHFVHRSVCVGDDEFMSWIQHKEEAVKDVLKRYFAYYGPATIADFCHWSGLTKSEAQKALTGIRDSLHSFSFEKKEHFVPQHDPLLSDITDSSNNVVKLLGKFDPLFVSFHDKTWIADPIQQKAIWRPAAHIEAVLLVNDEVAGTWRYVMKGDKIDFQINLFRSIPLKTKKAVEKEAEKISGFLLKKLNVVTYV